MATKLAIVRYYVDEDPAGARQDPGAVEALTAAIAEHGARMAALSSEEEVSKWSQLEVLMSSWRRREAALERPGSYLLAVSRTTVRDVALS